MARVGTLGDLERNRHLATIYCPNFHPASWPGWYLVQRYGAELPLQTFMDRCRCSICDQRADDLKVASFSHGMAIDLATRYAYKPPPEIAEPVLAIGALAADLWSA
jgi:hypothetical protein